MFQPLVILVMLLPALRETTGQPAWLGRVGPWGVIAITLGTVIGLWALSHALIWAAGRAIDRHGSLAAAARADRIAGMTRIAMALMMVPAVVALGWLDAIRTIVGDVVFLDEMLATLPAIAGMIGTWWSFYPIERRFREALLVRDLDQGRTIHAIPTRARYVLTMSRHMLALSFVPLAIILAWRECVPWLAHWMARVMGEVGAAEVALSRGWLEPALQFLGALAVLVLIPPIVRRVWETVPLGAGALRTDLLALCAREGVRVRELLVWRTGGTMLNGAVMGLIPRLRYILLTDALLESLTLRQVRAVMAHEVAHVRLRHMPWMWLACLAMVLTTGLAGDWLITRRAAWLPPAPWDELLVGGTSIAATLLAFGWISRRFEWQADAFAVRHLSDHEQPGVSPVSPLSITREEMDEGPSGSSGGSGPGSPMVQVPGVRPEAVLAMVGALQQVAVLNHIPLDRFNWRHGSIAVRIQRLRALLGSELSSRPPGNPRRFAIDRTAAWIKRATLGMFLLSVAWMWWTASRA